MVVYPNQINSQVSCLHKKEFALLGRGIRQTKEQVQ